MKINTVQGQINQNLNYDILRILIKKNYWNKLIKTKI